MVKEELIGSCTVCSPIKVWVLPTAAQLQHCKLSLAKSYPKLTSRRDSRQTTKTATSTKTTTTTNMNANNIVVQSGCFIISHNYVK